MKGLLSVVAIFLLLFLSCHEASPQADELQHNAAEGGEVEDDKACPASTSDTAKKTLAIKEGHQRQDLFDNDNSKNDINVSKKGESEVSLQPETTSTLTSKEIEKEGEEDDDEDTPPQKSLSEKLSSCQSDLPCILKHFQTDKFLHDYWEQVPFVFQFNRVAGLVQWQDVVNTAKQGELKWSSPNEVKTFDSSTSTTTATSQQRYQGQEMTQAVMEKILLVGKKHDNTSSNNKKVTLTMHHFHTINQAVADMFLPWQQALGLTINVNLMASNNGGAAAVWSPLRTFRTDTFWMQSTGKERIQVYEAPVHFPVWGVRGTAEWGHGEQQHGDGGGGLSKKLLKSEQPLIDVTLQPGDVLYIPRGCAFSTMSISENNNAKVSSIALAMTPNTEAHHYVFEKMVRCALSKAGFCDEIEDNNDDDDKKSCGALGRALIQYARSTPALRRAVPVGFLNPQGDWFSYVRAVANKCLTAIRHIFQKVHRNDIPKSATGSKEQLDNLLPEVAGRVFTIIKADLVEMQKLFAGNHFYDEDDYPYSERQLLWRRVFNKIGPYQQGFCHKEGPKVFFQDYFSSELEPDDFTKMTKARASANKE